MPNTTEIRHSLLVSAKRSSGNSIHIRVAGSEAGLPNHQVGKDDATLAERGRKPKNTIVTGVHYIEVAGRIHGQTKRSR